MTDIERKALALLNKVNTERNKKGATFVYVDRSSCVLTEALCRAIEQHEHFERDVSDKVEAAKRVYGGHREAFDQLDELILPKPVDPLVEVIREMALADATCEDADRLRAALAKRNARIVWEAE